MKNSNYNIVIKGYSPDDIFLFNSISRGMKKVNKQIIAAIMNENFELLSQNEIEDLKGEGFIIDNWINEMSLLKHKYELEKYDSHFVDFTLAPTMSCNLKCSYCFEKGHKSDKLDFMSDLVQDKLIDYINLLSETVNKGIHVVWFGGEPLLGINIIKSLTPRIKNIAVNKNLTYTCSMTTNGILIIKNDKIIKDLIDNDIKQVQITLDGFNVEHNKRRMYKDGKGTFEDIISAIKILKHEGIKVGIRVNVDKENHKTFENLFKKLKEKDILDLEIGFGHLRDYSNTKDMFLFNVNDFCKIVLKAEDIINKYRNDDYISLPVLSKPCVANRKNSFVIDSKGYIYKCRTLIGNHKYSIGNILHLNNINTVEYMNIANWVSWNPFQYKGCIKCKILPICMGGCTYNCFLNNNKPECTEWKYMLKPKLLQLYYKNYLHSKYIRKEGR